MTREQIEQIAALLVGTDIACLELAGPQGQWRITHEAGQTRISFVADADRITVTALHAGVFLTCHPLRNNPLIMPTDQVKQGQVIGLLKAGPLLKPVVAPCDGALIATTVCDGALVGYGTQLFELQAGTSGR
jgi:biotin carboxyl carrier protein